MIKGCCLVQRKYTGDPPNKQNGRALKILKKRRYEKLYYSKKGIKN